MARSSKLMKRRGSQLEIRVHKACHHNPRKPSDHTIQLKLFTNSLKQYYLHKPTSSLIGLEEVTTGEQTLCVDRRDFFESDSSIKILKSILEPLNVKEDIVNKIIRQVMRCGKRMNHKEDFQGLGVTMTFIKTFVGDRVSVHKALKKLDQQRNDYLRQRGGFNVVHVVR